MSDNDAVVKCRAALASLEDMRRGLYCHPLGEAIDVLSRHLPGILNTHEIAHDDLTTAYLVGAASTKAKTEPEDTRCLDFKDYDCTIPKRRNYLLRWTFLGEGLDGDYDDTNEHDTPFLRADLHFVNTGVVSEEAVCSYCTLAPTWTPKKI